MLSSKFEMFAALTTLTLIFSTLLSCTGLKEGTPRTFLIPPGSAKFDLALIEKIEKKKTQTAAKYIPRTKHHQSSDEAKYINRLFLESSPYLLQHAHNPVNWYPWGDEAFETAKRLKRPVLLSIGYSTCHWCHVMEEESFENLEIARSMNQNYIAIKVDREERPDLDAVYMSALHAMGQNGGWPMTVWLTPDRKPFYGTTYIPPHTGDRGARIGFFEILAKLHSVYDEQPEKVKNSSDRLANTIQKNLAPQNGRTRPHSRTIQAAVSFYKTRLDPKYGGLDGRPKFPSGLPVKLLLRHYRRSKDKDALNAAILSLKRMSEGGMYDHVGGGFHRYSTDSKWLVPHFEKMLYDNALLASTYLEAFQITGNPDFKRITEEILHYIQRDMTSPQGAFYSATDADSLTSKGGHREEGWFFTWTPKGIKSVLNPLETKLALRYYAIEPKGNFEGRSILHTPRSLSSVAKGLKLTEKQARKKVNQIREKLYHERKKRPPPLRDEKTLVAWNGLMISAFSQASLILNNEKYLSTARRAADFILTYQHKEGRLFRSQKDGQVKSGAFLNDYAFFIAALLDLYEASSELKWLTHALELDQTLENHFEDKEFGGFFMTSSDQKRLIAKEKPARDGAEPSGNSVAILNLLRFQEFTTQDSYRRRAEKALKAFSEVLESSPMALSEMLLALDFYFDRPKEIIIVSPKGQKSASEPLLIKFRSQFLPNRIFSFVEEGEELQKSAEIIPLLRAKIAMDGKPTAYVCEKGVCQLPTDSPSIFAKQISKLSPLPVSAD